MCCFGDAAEKTVLLGRKGVGRILFVRELSRD
jgi:hypothetical protein